MGDWPVPARAAAIGDDSRLYSSETTHPPEAWNDHLLPIPVGSPKARAPRSLPASGADLAPKRSRCCKNESGTPRCCDSIGPCFPSLPTAPTSSPCNRPSLPASAGHSREEIGSQWELSKGRASHRPRRTQGLAGASRNLNTALSSTRRPGFEEGMPTAVGGSLSLDVLLFNCAARPATLASHGAWAVTCPAGDLQTSHRSVRHDCPALMILHLMRRTPAWHPHDKSPPHA